MTQTRLAASVSAFALVLGAPALAQDGTISIYTYQTAVGLDAVGATVDVLDEDQIEDLPEASTAAKLDSLPGVSVTQAGPFGGVTNLRLRGLSGAYVPVLFNGIDITDTSATRVELYWENILPGTVSRAEVIRGSQSARFGANAIAGAIALDGTRAPQAPGQQASVKAEIGSYDSTLFNLGLGFATERAGVAISFGKFGSGGFSAIKGDPAMDDTDGYEGEQLSFDSYVDITDSLRVGLTGFRHEGTSEYDSCGPWPYTQDCRTENASQGLRGYVELSYGNFSHVFDATSFEITRDRIVSGAPSGTSEGDRHGWSYRGTYTPSEAYTLSFGLDEKQEGSSAAPNDVTIAGQFVEALWAPQPGLDLALSIRRDDHSSFGEFWSGRASVSYGIGDTTIRAVAANGFRAPSLYELFDPLYGNATLDPETSKSFELGVDHVFSSGASIGGTLFYTEIEDLIDYFDPDGWLGPIPGGYAQMSGTSVTKGVEISALFPLGQMAQIEGNYTYTDAQDRNGNQLQRVPEHDLALTLSGDLNDRLSGALTAQYKGGWADTFGATSFKAGDNYTLVNARIGYEFAPGIEGYARIENLFDTDYQVIPDYQTAGRSVYFGINADF